MREECVKTKPFSKFSIQQTGVLCEIGKKKSHRKKVKESKQNNFPEVKNMHL